MKITYQEEKRIFKLDTAHTSYIIGITDDEGFIGHVYYGAYIRDEDVTYLLRTGERPLVPSVNNRERGAFYDTFPCEYPGNGLGDYRESAVAILDQNGNTAVQPLYTGYRICDGKPEIPGLPATFGTEKECQTL